MHRLHPLAIRPLFIDSPYEWKSSILCILLGLCCPLVGIKDIHFSIYLFFNLFIYLCSPPEFKN